MSIIKFMPLNKFNAMHYLQICLKVVDRKISYLFFWLKGVTPSESPMPLFFDGCRLPI